MVVSRYKNKDATRGIYLQRPACPCPTEAIYKGTSDTTQASTLYCGNVTPPRSDPALAARVGRLSRIGTGRRGR